MLDAVMARLSKSPAARAALVPLARACVRYAPAAAGTPWLWSRIVEPYLAWHPRRYRAATAFGFRLDGDSQDLIQQWIYYFGVWEPSLTAWIRRRLRPGDTFVDVGANIGYFALVCGSAVGDRGRVVAIEASPAIVEQLERNVRLNAMTNIRTVHAAALGSRGTVRLYRGSDANCGETTIDEQYGGVFEAEVRALPLQELLTADEITGARLIKIDTEGAEYSILKGFDAFSRLRRDAELIVELHPTYLAHRGESVDALLDLMAGEGFHAYLLAEEYWAPSYLRRGLAAMPPPARLRAPVTEDGTVVIFSRIDADVLESPAS